jgi:hypothetical protein
MTNNDLTITSFKSNSNKYSNKPWRTFARYRSLELVEKSFKTRKQGETWGKLVYDKFHSTDLKQEIDQLKEKIFLTFRGIDQ